MKHISDADWIRMNGAFMFGVALAENQYQFDANVVWLYAISAILIFIGFIMNEDFEM